MRTREQNLREASERYWRNRDEILIQTRERYYRKKWEDRVDKGIERWKHIMKRFTT